MKKPVALTIDPTLMLISPPPPSLQNTAANAKDVSQPDS
jgi:hypothetical protein